MTVVVSEINTDRINNFSRLINKAKKSIENIGQLLSEYPKIEEVITSINNEFNIIKINLDDIASTMNKIKKEDFDIDPSHYKPEELMESIRYFIKFFTDNILDKITTNETKKDIIRALLNIITFFEFCYDRKRMYQSFEADLYKNSIKTLAFFIGIDHDELHLLMDLFTKDPARIFRFEDPLPDIDPRLLKFQCNISKARLNMISEIFSISLENVRRIAALWTYPQNLINLSAYQTDISWTKQKIIEMLGKDIIGVDSSFLNYLGELKSTFERGDNLDLAVS